MSEMMLSVAEIFADQIAEFVAEHIERPEEGTELTETLMQMIHERLKLIDWEAQMEPQQNMRVSVKAEQEKYGKTELRVFKSARSRFGVTLSWLPGEVPEFTWGMPLNRYDRALHTIDQAPVNASEARAFMACLSRAIQLAENMDAEQS